VCMVGGRQIDRDEGEESLCGQAGQEAVQGGGAGGADTGEGASAGGRVGEEQEKKEREREREREEEGRMYRRAAAITGESSASIGRCCYPHPLLLRTLSRLLAAPFRLSLPPTCPGPHSSYANMLSHPPSTPLPPPANSLSTCRKGRAAAGRSGVDQVWIASPARMERWRGLEEPFHRFARRAGGNDGKGCRGRWCRWIGRLEALRKVQLQVLQEGCSLLRATGPYSAACAWGAGKGPLAWERWWRNGSAFSPGPLVARLLNLRSLCAIPLYTCMYAYINTIH
jgi:hypothetical protein